MATAKAKNVEKGAAQLEDQSMEEILQSIRKIIAEESDEALMPEEDEEEDFEDLEVESDVLELTDVVQDDGSIINLNALDDVLNNIDDALEEEAATEESLEQESQSLPESIFEDEEEDEAPEPFIPPAMEPVAPEPVAKPKEKPAAPPAPPPPVAATAESEDDGLVSDLSAAVSREALKALKASNNKLTGQLHFTSGETVEGLVAQLLRPMLKEWLDANLPGIVQTEVQREVQRISSSLEQNG